MKKITLGCIILLTAISAFVLYQKWDAIFQRGNPIPYLMAAAQLSDEVTYAAVEGMENVYISRRGDCSQLFEYIQDTYSLEFRDQLGSGWLFVNGTDGFIVSSEIYWGKYTVWTLPESSFPFLPSEKASPS